MLQSRPGETEAAARAHGPARGCPLPAAARTSRTEPGPRSWGASVPGESSGAAAPSPTALRAEMTHCAGAEVRTCSFKMLTCLSVRTPRKRSFLLSLRAGGCLAIFFLPPGGIKQRWTCGSRSLRCMTMGRCPKRVLDAVIVPIQ